MPCLVVSTHSPYCLEGKIWYTLVSMSPSFKSNLGVMAPHLLMRPVSSTTIFLARLSSMTSMSLMYPKLLDDWLDEFNGKEALRTVFLHHFEESDDDGGHWSQKNLSLAGSLGVDHFGQTVWQHSHTNHFLYRQISTCLNWQWDPGLSRASAESCCYSPVMITTGKRPTLWILLCKLIIIISLLLSLKFEHVIRSWLLKCGR